MSYISSSVSGQGTMKLTYPEEGYVLKVQDDDFLDTDGSSQMKANLDVGNHSIVNLNDPVHNKDAVNLQYLNNQFGQFFKSEHHQYGFMVSASATNSDTQTINLPFTGTFHINTHIVFWSNESTPHNTSIRLAMTAPSGQTSYVPIEPLSAGYTPAWPNIPNDNATTLYVNNSVIFNNVNQFTITLYVKNNYSSAQAYNMHFHSTIIPGVSETTV